MFSLSPKNSFRLHSDPLRSLQRDFDHVVGSLLREDSATPSTTYSPRINIIDAEKAIRVSAELPGLDEKDVEINITRDELILSGEKKIDKEEDVQGRHYVERSYGTFKRVLLLPEDLDTEKAEAVFKKGVLTITIPRKAEALRSARKLIVKSE